MQTTIVKIGEVGVDSGQLLITDPSYIDEYWKKEEFEDIRIYKHKVTGDQLQYQVDFEKFNIPILKYGNLDMNALLATGEWDELPAPKAKTNFSYNACCQTTVNDDIAGQLNYDMGHAGIGVAFRTGFGDGTYDVYAEIIDDPELGKRVKRIFIDFFFMDTDDKKKKQSGK